MNTSVLLCLVVGTSLFMAAVLFKLFFRDWKDFNSGVDSLFRNMAKQNWSTVKVWVWLLFSVGFGFASYYQLPKWFPDFFR